MTLMDKRLYIIMVIIGFIGWLFIVRVNQLTKENRLLHTQLAEQILLHDDFQRRITQLNQLDVQHTKELTHAKVQINHLRDAVNAGYKRVYVQAECPKYSENSTQSTSNDTTSRLNKTAEQDYVRLREMIIENEQQTMYLQHYINTECLSN